MRANARATRVTGNEAASSVLLANAPRVEPRLRVLVIDEWLPYPLDSGKRVRTWNLLSRAATHHHIELLCFGQDASPAAKEVRATGIEVHTVVPPPKLEGWRLYLDLMANSVDCRPYSVAKHYSRRFETRLRALLRSRKFDLVHCEWTPYAQYLRCAPKIPHFIMAHNIESQIWWRRARHSRGWVEKTFFRMQAEKMAKFECAALRDADGAGLVTPVDLAQALSWGARNLCLAENGVNPGDFAPRGEDAGSKQVLCLGALDWYPNLDAARHLLNDLWPAIKAQAPDATLRVVGRGAPPDLVRQVLGRSGVTMVGDVEDVRPEFARASVVAIPLRIGGGSRIKILEAMAMGRAVVTTPVGTEGLSVTNGVHLALAKSPAAFVKSTVELLNSPEERQRLGQNGRSLVEDRYTWDRSALALERAWIHLVAKNVSGPIRLRLREV